MKKVLLIAEVMLGGVLGITFLIWKEGWIKKNLILDLKRGQ